MNDQISEYICGDIETIFKKYSKDNTRYMTKKEIECFMREFMEKKRLFFYINLQKFILFN